MRVPTNRHAHPKSRRGTCSTKSSGKFCCLPTSATALSKSPFSSAWYARYGVGRLWKNR